jgi:hypothetical protein
MSESIVSVNIDLLDRHPDLPGAHTILERFSAHHAQSEARRKAHDELMQSDSNLELEDFGSLAASALGENESQSDVLGEDAQPFVPETANVSSDDMPPADESTDATAAPEDHPDTPDQDASTNEELPVDTEPAEVAADNPSLEENAEAEPQQAEAPTTKKRTRKRKKKKK